MEQLGPVPAGEHEVGEALAGVDAHQVKKDRLFADRHERLRHLETVGVGPGPLASAEDQGLHQDPFSPSDMPADAIGGVVAGPAGDRGGGQGIPPKGSLQGVATLVPVPPFEVISPFKPAGDQPAAIRALAQGVRAGERYQTLLGITGSGKTATVAWTIEAVQRPTLVIEPNKSLAAQLASELKELFPKNRVEYFVSYYDYYQPEAYLPTTDTYIEKDSSINDEIDRLRHSTTSSLLLRRDVIVVASVSCIYGLGSPEEYREPDPRRPTRAT